MEITLYSFRGYFKCLVEVSKNIFTHDIYLNKSIIYRDTHSLFFKQIANVKIVCNECSKLDSSSNVRWFRACLLKMAIFVNRKDYILRNIVQFEPNRLQRIQSKICFILIKIWLKINSILSDDAIFVYGKWLYMVYHGITIKNLCLNLSTLIFFVPMEDLNKYKNYSFCVTFRRHKEFLHADINQFNIEYIICVTINRF